MGSIEQHENVIAIRDVITDDCATADRARIPYDILANVSKRITNEAPGINRIVHDITSKPPATVEWEQTISSRCLYDMYRTVSGIKKRRILYGSYADI